MGDATNVLKSLLPRKVKGALRRVHRDVTFRRYVGKFSGLDPGVSIDQELMDGLICGWGNAAWSIEIDYAQAIVDSLRGVHGNVLECGSGLSTVMMGVLTRGEGPRIWALEHHGQWAQKVRKALEKLNVRSVRVCHAPLRSYGEFSWYSVPEELPEIFDMVVCDGPPADTPGGRFGLMPVMQKRLNPGAVVLLDDLERPAEQAILEKWRGMTNATTSTRGHEHPYGVLTMPQK